MNNASRARLDELNDQIDEARATSQRAWKRFDEERQAFAQKGITSTNSTEFKRVTQLKEDYEATTPRLRDLEQMRNVIFDEMAEQSTGKSAATGSMAPGSWLSHELKRATAAVGGV